MHKLIFVTFFTSLLLVGCLEIVESSQLGKPPIRETSETPAPELSEAPQEVFELAESTSVRNATAPLITQDVETLPNNPYGISIYAPEPNTGEKGEILKQIRRKLPSGSSLWLSVVLGENQARYSQFNLKSKDGDSGKVKFCLHDFNRTSCESVVNVVLDSENDGKHETNARAFTGSLPCARAELELDAGFEYELSICENGYEPLLAGFRYYYGAKVNATLYKASGKFSGAFDISLDEGITLDTFQATETEKQLVIYSLKAGELNQAQAFTLPTRTGERFQLELGNLRSGADEYCYQLIAPIKHKTGTNILRMGQCVK